MIVKSFVFCNIIPHSWVKNQVKESTKQENKAMITLLYRGGYMGTCHTLQGGANHKTGHNKHKIEESVLG